MTTTSADEMYLEALAKAMALSEEKRRELAHELLAQEDAIDDEMMSDAWLEKMRGRLARVRNGEAKLFTGEEMRAEMQRRVAQRRK